MSSSVRPRRYAVVEAPSILGLRPTGVETLPEALLQAGLVDRLRARHRGRVEPETAYDPSRDPAHLTLNASGIASFSHRLADAIGPVIDAGEFPVVLGGDCSILLGSLLALRRRGRYGLLFVDGHADFYQPEANPNGEVASMELAIATGRGPDILADLERRRPLVRDHDVVAFGFRDRDEQAAYGSQPLPGNLLALDLPAIRRCGVSTSAREAVASLTRGDGPEAGFWIHVDADVLDDALMPAVDYRLPGGLSWAELTQTLQIAVQSGHAVGLELTIYNPKLDAEGTGARQLAGVLAAALLGSSS
jgi:arginase